jgi:hypothetical protein
MRRRKATVVCRNRAKEKVCFDFFFQLKFKMAEEVAGMWVEEDIIRL